MVATRNYDLLTDSLTGVKCRATSVAKKPTSLDGEDVGQNLFQEESN